MRASLAAGEAQVGERLVVDGKKPMVAPYSGAMFAMVARSASGISPGRAEELDELVHDAVLAQHLGDAQDEVGRGAALGQLAGQRTPTTSGSSM
jgi:hypothetical protein